MHGTDVRRLKSSWHKSIGFVWGLAADCHCSTIIRWISEL